MHIKSAIKTDCTLRVQSDPIALFNTMQYNPPAKRDDAEEAPSFIGEREKEKNAYKRNTAAGKQA